MDERTRAEVIRSLRSAARALRMAEQAIIRAPSEAPSPVAPTPLPQAPAEPAPVAALLTFIEGAASAYKEYEEQNPASFAKRLQGVDLLKFAFDRKLYQVGPDGTGAVRPDTYAAFTLFEKCLAVMTKVEVDATEVVKPFTDKPTLKHWAEVDQNSELALMHYQTEGEVPCPLDEQQLLPLVEAARSTPGALQRVTALLAEKGVRWEPVVDNKIHPLVSISDVKANWAAVINSQAVAQSIADRLAIVEVDQNNNQHGWWAAAQADQNVPQALLPLIRGNEMSLFVKQDEANNIEDWASKLPGWYEGSPEAPNPLSIRNVTTSDILV